MSRRLATGWVPGLPAPYQDAETYRLDSAIAALDKLRLPKAAALHKPNGTAPAK